MKLMTLAPLLLITACTTRPGSPRENAKPVPAPKSDAAADLVDHFGDSPASAVPVPPDALNEGVDFENNWMYDRFGRFRRLKYGLARDGNGRRYDVITIEVPDHSEHVIYFDMTELWNKWQPSSPK